MNIITNTEMAILGLAAEGPQHGYQIEQTIATRGMREWTEIGFSSIYYILNKLEKSGWLASEVMLVSGSEGRGGPARRVYQLTGAGLAVLRSAVRERLAHPRLRSGDFDLALANQPVLPPGEAREALQENRDGLRQRLEQVRAKLDSDRAGAQRAGHPFPVHVEALFSRSLALMQAELDWLNKYLSQLETGDANNPHPR